MVSCCKVFLNLSLLTQIVFVGEGLGSETVHHHASIKQFTTHDRSICSLLSMHVHVGGQSNYWHIHSLHSNPHMANTSSIAYHLRLYGVCDGDKLEERNKNGGIAILLGNTQTDFILHDTLFRIPKFTNSTPRFIYCFFTTNHNTFSHSKVCRWPTIAKCHKLTYFHRTIRIPSDSPRTALYFGQ